MAKLKIPDSDRPVIRAIGSASDAEFEAFLGGLRELRPTISIDRLSSDLTARLESIGEKVTKDVLKTVISLNVAFSRASVTKAEFVRDVCDALEEGPAEKVPEAIQAALMRRLPEVIQENGPLALTAKAAELISEEQRVFCDVRVLSDLRPVFLGDVAVTPKEFLMIHNIRICFYENGEHKEFYAALDSADLRNLKNAVQRAETKAETLTNLVHSVGFTLIDQE